MEKGRKGDEGCRGKGDRRVVGEREIGRVED